MRPILALIASVVIMLCLGGVYAWSLFVPELRAQYGYSSAQLQFVFGALIAVFPLTMILAAKFQARFSTRALVAVSSILFALGYGLAAISQGNYWLLLLGVGVLGGMATGCGYLAAITLPVLHYPKQKGLMTGVAAAGFGLAAVLLTFWATPLLEVGLTVGGIFAIQAVVYGLLMAGAALLMHGPKVELEQSASFRIFAKEAAFIRLFLGIFFGTFAGLLVIGNLKPMGELQHLTNSILILSVSIFAVANFAGRLSWGYCSDRLGAPLSILLALALQSLAIFLLALVPLNDALFLVLACLIGFGFGGNFVLFAKETAQLYGVHNVAKVYPYVFLGYALAGIFGPLTGGLLYDWLGGFTQAAYIAALLSLFGALTFVWEVLPKKQSNTEVRP